mgnify:CR=1 FL=1
MWLAPEVILSYQVDNTILAIITKPSKNAGENPGLKYTKFFGNPLNSLGVVRLES